MVMDPYDVQHLLIVDSWVDGHHKYLYHVAVYIIKWKVMMMGRITHMRIVVVLMMKM